MRQIKELASRLEAGKAVWRQDQERIIELVNQREELLAALKRIDSMCEKPIRYGSIAVQEAARAAIAKAGGEV